MKYTLVSGNIKLKYASFERATTKLIKLGTGKLFYGRVLVGEL